MTKFFKTQHLKSGILAVFMSVLSFAAFASAEAHSEGEKFDPVAEAMHHALDAHSWHMFNFDIPLPIILYTDNGLVTFMSSAFGHDAHGHTVVERNGMQFVNVHEKIYQLNAGEHHAAFDADGHLTNGVKPLDFSITKNVAAMLVTALILILVFIVGMRRQYKSGTVGAPRKLASWMEPLVLFVRDDIAKNNIGHKYHKFMPFLLTLFFFIWVGNLLGLIPFLGNPNMTGNISVTLVLAALTLIVQLLFSNKNFWGHIFWMPGVPVPMKIFLAPIELLGIFTKPFALMIRLFANITAGHIIIVSLISIIFINKSASWAGLSVPMALFISVLELLVAFLQAYIFTMLAALFIGTAVEEAHH